MLTRGDSFFGFFNARFFGQLNVQSGIGNQRQ